MLLPRTSPAALMRTSAFIASCVISFVLNGSLTFAAVHAQFTAFYQQPLLHYLPLWKSVTVGGMQVSLSTDLFVTALVIAWLTAYLGSFQPRKDVIAGKLSPVHPLYLHYGTWWLFPELRYRSPCLRATLLSLHFGFCWTIFEFGLFALLAYTALPAPQISVVSYQWIKAAFAGIEGVIITRLTFVATCAHAAGSPDATPLVHSCDMPHPGPVKYKALPAGAVAPFSAAIHGQDSVTRVRDADAMAVADAKIRSEVEADRPRLAQEADSAAHTIVQDLEGQLRRHSNLRIAILTVGTRGDVQPFVGLAQALKRAGHRPVICTTRDFERFVEDNGVEYADGIVPTIEQPDEWLTATTIAEMFYATASHFEEYYPNMGRAFYKACTEPECDVILVTAMTISLGLDLGEALHKPVWACKLAPDIPTRAYPPPGMTAAALPIGNLLKHYLYWGRVAGAAGKTNLTRLENTFRREVLGLGPFAGMRRLKDMGSTPYILGVSPTLMPKPQDWPASASVAGFWFMNAQPNYTLPDRVTAFLEAGPPPVCVTFGSMMLIRRGKFMQWVLDALRELNQRVLLITGWADPPENLPDSVLSVEALPHEHIFHRCRAVVHHGGAGTSGRVLEAGVPSIVIPILRWTDQPLFGQRAAELGCGACVLKTSYEAVRSAIAYSIDPAGDVPMKARQVGIRIAAENEKAFDRVVLSLEQDTRIQRPSTPRQ